MTIVVGITGGIGSGKSTFSGEVLKRGGKLLDSDKEVGVLYKNPKKEFIDHLKKIGLAKSIKNKKINKKIIRDIIFDDKQVKSKLEKYIFKIIRKNRKNFINKEKKIGTKTLFFDVPLLFENNLKKDFDIIISIISTKKNRLKRLKFSKKITKKTFKNILSFQTSDVIRKSKSDIVMYNNGTREDFIKKTKIVLDRIMEWERL